MDQTEYREVYLCSEHWQAKRAEALLAAGNRCQVCNTGQRLDVHHRTYANVGNEQPGDLTVLCRACHDLYHQSKRPKGNAKRGAKITKKNPKQSKPKKAPQQDELTKRRNAKRAAKQQKHRSHIQEEQRKAVERRIGARTEAEQKQQARYEEEREMRRQARIAAEARIREERAARAKADFDEPRVAKPWDKHETRISGAVRDRRDAGGAVM